MAFTKQPLTSQKHKDTWIDEALDRLRENRFSPVVEVLLSWIVSLFCLIYYFYSWCVLFLRSPPITSVPLMTYDPLQHEGLEETLFYEILEDIESDTELVNLIRGDDTLRRKVSAFVLTSKHIDCRALTNRQRALRERLVHLWAKILKFPELIVLDKNGKPIAPFAVSLIIPAYKEEESVILDTLSWALRRCCHPESIQVIIVISQQQEQQLNLASSCWGSVQTVVYDGCGGRGPCHNEGAKYALGQVLTFVHADTILAPDWDVRVLSTLLSSKRIVQACAFTFGHNTQKLDGMPFPYGIRSVWLLGNLRAYFLSLPYGDHTLSMPTVYFRYVGGFPHQPIMEDYDLMDLLRKRAKVLPKEQIQIIPPPEGKCSVRRWQRLGVVYVTLVNALMVNRYTHGGWTAQEVFDYYYRRPSSSHKKSK